MAVSQRPAATTGSAGSATAWWRRRFDEEGVEGLVDRSSVPHHQPTKTDPEGTEKILWLRQQYHFGPPRISMYLVRYHDVTISPPVWRILHKLGLNRLPASQRYTCTQTRRKRYEKQCPATNCRWTCIFIEPLAQTRKRREEALLPSALQSMTARKIAIQFIDHALSKLPSQAVDAANSQRTMLATQTVGSTLVTKRSRRSPSVYELLTLVGAAPTAVDVSQTSRKSRTTSRGIPA